MYCQIIHLDCNSTMFRSIVFSGGATLALSFFGCLQFLEHMGALAGVDTFVGCSAGSLVAFLTVLGFTPREACEYFMQVGVKQHTVTELDVFDAVFGERTCLESLGLDQGTHWQSFLSDALTSKLGIKDVTFSELAQTTGKVFVVCVTNLTKSRREYLSVDTCPEMSVLLAVRISMAVPLLYAPVLYRGSLYVDGGLLDNLPLAHFEKKGPPTTLALFLRRVADTKTHTATDVSLPSPMRYLGMLVSVVMTHAQQNNGNMSGQHRHESCAYGSDSKHVMMVGVPVQEAEAMSCGFNFRSLDFDVNEERINELVSRGYTAARDTLKMFTNHPEIE